MHPHSTTSSSRSPLRKGIRTKLVAGLAAGAGIAGLAVAAMPSVASAQPQNVICRGSLGAVVVDNLEVPEFARCTLNGTQVLGSVDVALGARLAATAISVRGNVQGQEAAVVNVARSTIGGSVQIIGGVTARVAGSTVAGDILVDGQSGAVTVSNNRVGTGVAGNVEIFGNLGGTTVSSNRIAGNLSCKDNLPAPVGTGNVVGGNKEDQCLLL